MPLDRESFFTSPAVAEVASGGVLAEVAKRHGIPGSTLTKMVRTVHPGMDLRGARETPIRAAELAVRAAELALSTAKSRLAELMEAQTV